MVLGAVEMVLLRPSVHVNGADTNTPDGSKKNGAGGSGGVLERYDVTNRVKHDEETDDERGSRAFPSRTSFGQRWEIASKSGIDTGPLKLFGIPISGMMYYVNWVLTSAQLDLIAADVSVVDYSYGRKKDKKRGRKGEFNDEKASMADVNKAREEWLRKYGDKPKTAGTGGIAMSDVFGGFEIKKE